ncbi:MAG: carboxypeptidase regulatory-like domain-containing protein [Planctomycetota bacterium]
MLQELLVRAPGHALHAASSPTAAWSGLLLKANDGGVLFVELEPLAAVHGRVTNVATDAAVAGARVLVLPGTSTRGSNLYPLLEATSDEEGRYRLEGVPPGMHLLLALGSGYVTHDLVVHLREGEAPASMRLVITPDANDVERDVAVSAMVPVRGVVVDANDQPVAGAAVLETSLRSAGAPALSSILSMWGSRAPSGMTPDVRSAEDGSFMTWLLPRPDVVLVAQAEGLAGWPSAPFTVEANVPPPPQRLVLVPPVVVRGRVLQGNGDTPAAGALVMARSSWKGPAVWMDGAVGTNTREDGRFELAGVVPGHVVLAASQGPQRTELDLGEVEPGGERLEVELRLDAELHDLVLRAVDAETAAPLAGVDLRVRAPQYSGSAQRTASDGRAHFPNVPRGVTNVYQVLGGRETLLRDDVAMPAEGVVDIPCQSVARRQFVVQLELPDGTPPAAARAALRAGSRLGTWSTHAVGHEGDTTMLGGRHAFLAEGDGPWTLTIYSARDEAGQPLAVFFDQVVVTATEIAEGSPRVVRGRPAGLIRVRVVSADGEPVERATVGIPGVPSQVMTDATGRAYSVTADDAPRVTVQVRARGALTDSRGYDVPTDGSETEIRLPRTASLAGRVVEEDGAPPGPGVVQVSYLDVGGSRRYWTASVAEDGTFEVSGLPPDTAIEVRVTIATGAPGRIQLGVPAGTWPAGARDLEIRLPSGKALRGRVLDAEGAPVAGASVTCDEPGDDGEQGPRGRVLTDAHGRFTFERVPSGEWVLVAQAPGPGRLVTPPRTVRAGAANLELVLPASSRISGRIAGVRGPGWVVIAAPGAGDPNGTSSTEVRVDGAFTLAGIPAGATWALWAISAEDTRVARRVGVASGDFVVMDLVDGQSISGRCASRGGASLPGLLVVASHPDGVSRHVPVQPDGTFEVRGLLAGPWELVAVKTAGFQRWSESVEGVQAGTREVVLAGP